MRSESDPKISTGIVKNENGRGYEREWAAQTKKVRARGGQRSACDKKRSAHEAEKVRSLNERSASGENGSRAKCESHKRSTRGHDE